MSPLGVHMSQRCISELSSHYSKLMAFTKLPFVPTRIICISRYLWIQYILKKKKHPENQVHRCHHDDGKRVHNTVSCYSESLSILSFGARLQI